jgi:hypothetical protein
MRCTFHDKFACCLLASCLVRVRVQPKKHGLNFELDAVFSEERNEGYSLCSRFSVISPLKNGPHISSTHTPHLDVTRLFKVLSPFIVDEQHKHRDKKPTGMEVHPA